MCFLGDVNGIKAFDISFTSNLTKSDLPIILDDKGKVYMKNVDGGLEKAKIARRDVYDKSSQIFRAIDLFINSGQRFFNKFLIPILVTNTKLYAVKYHQSDIQPEGDLKENIKIEEVPFVAYNTPRILKWDERKQDVSLCGHLSAGISREMKTILIVNINNLKKLIKFLNTLECPEKKEKEIKEEIKEFKSFLQWEETENKRFEKAISKV